MRGFPVPPVWFGKLRLWSWNWFTILLGPQLRLELAHSKMLDMLGGHDNLSTIYLPKGIYTVIMYKVDGSGNNSMATWRPSHMTCWSYVTLMQMDFLFLPCHRMAYYWESFAIVEMWYVKSLQKRPAIFCHLRRIHFSDFIWRFFTNDFARSMVVLKRSKALKHGGYSVFAGVGLLACNATCVFAFGDSERLSKMTGMHRKHRHDWPYLGSGTKSSMVEATRLRGKHIKRGHNQRAQQQWQWHFLAQLSNREKVQGHNFRLKRLRQAK